jgi:uncharacterized protein (TIGR03435 family)
LQASLAKVQTAGEPAHAAKTRRRVKLAAHRDTRPTNGFVLTLGKDKRKMKEATGPAAGCGGSHE